MFASLRPNRFWTSNDSICRHLRSNRFWTSNDSICRHLRPNLFWTSNDSICRHVHSGEINLMPGPRIYRPNLWLTFKSMMSGHLMIRKSIDPNFTWTDFMKGARQAVCIVSNRVADGNFYGLEGLVAPEAIEEVKENLSKFGINEREKIRVKEEQILFNWAHSTDYTGGNGLPWRVSIMTVFHAVPGSKRRPTTEEEFIKFAKTPTQISNYRFSTQYLDGQSDGWVIDFLNNFEDYAHFAPPPKRE